LNIIELSSFKHIRWQRRWWLWWWVYDNTGDDYDEFNDDGSRTE